MDAVINSLKCALALKMGSWANAKVFGLKPCCLDEARELITVIKMLETTCSTFDENLNCYYEKYL